jgi:hypothetical protein
MAEQLAKGDGDETSEHARLSFAVRACEHDENLRFLLRLYLRQVNVLPQQSMFDNDPLQNAFNQGRQAAGLELIQLLSSVSPHLWMAIQLEEMNDAYQANVLERGNRGDSGSDPG